jgi:gluconokinase
VITGVAGSGKTTVGKLLAHDLGWPFHEGDDFHAAANVEKMRRG